jgi:ABC-type protease/lipase transport system fused ATPase/permease subunit
MKYKPSTAVLIVGAAGVVAVASSPTAITYAAIIAGTLFTGWAVKKYVARRNLRQMTGHAPRQQRPVAPVKRPAVKPPPGQRPPVKRDWVKSGKRTVRRQVRQFRRRTVSMVKKHPAKVATGGVVGVAALTAIPGALSFGLVFGGSILAGSLLTAFSGRMWARHERQQKQLLGGRPTP